MPTDQQLPNGRRFCGDFLLQDLPMVDDKIALESKNIDGHERLAAA